MKPSAVLIGIFGITILAYLPGLSGPFLFDDAQNLLPLLQWSNGEIKLAAVVFDNESGRFGRPISMLSFAVTTALLGPTPTAFKIGNLAIHLISGLLLFLLLRRIENRQVAGTPKTFSLALIATAIWLLHPMLVSTVLYSVQRMAMLSAMFSLAALLIYAIARERIERGETRTGNLILLVCVPVLVLLATFSKENGLLAFWLCIVLEFSIFRPRSDVGRTWAVRAFSLMFGLLPLVAAVIILTFSPERILGEYGNRPFTAAERLMTQGRVLWDYVFGLVLPNGSRYSLFREDYLISNSLFSPWTTALSWTGWLLVAGLAFRLRKKIPGFTFGIIFFLVAHSMESSILPLLIYFEHRNYLPSIGLIWAILSLLNYIAPALSAHLTAPRRLAISTTVLVVLVLAAATLTRSMVWQSEELLVRQTLERYPDSRHARLAMAQIELNRFPPDLEAAKQNYQHLIGLERPSTRMMGHAGLVASHCYVLGKVQGDSADNLFIETPEAVEADFLIAVIALRELLEKRGCEGLEPELIADRILSMLDRANLPPGSRSIWQLRFEAARLLNAGNRPTDAAKQALIAWTSSGDTNIGLFLLEIKIITGAFNDARVLADELEARIPRRNQTARNMLKSYLEILSIVDPDNNVSADEI